MKNNPLSGFKSLKAAVIDASSIIYMVKSGFFDLLIRDIQLHAPESCLKETGFQAYQSSSIKSVPPSPLPTNSFLSWHKVYNYRLFQKTEKYY